MEERVGAIWHNFITRMADKSYPEASVSLADIKKTIGVFFRALGGDGSLNVVQTDASEYNSERSFIRRIARSSEKYEFAWVDDNALRLPEVIDYFPQSSLNKDLYLWLAALASIASQSDNWFVDNQLRSQTALGQFPGLSQIYQRLLNAHLQQRPNLEKLSRHEQIIEGLIVQALKNPGSVQELPRGKYMPRPVILWLHPDPPIVLDGKEQDFGDSDNQRTDNQQNANDIGKKKAKRVDSPEDGRGLITIRMENIFTWGEFANLDRSTDDNEEDNAKEVAKDMDEMAISRNNRASKMQMKFDLDLPSEAMDDEVLSEGILLPEWDWKQQLLVQKKCRVVNLVSNNQDDDKLPDHLRSLSKKLRNQFRAITPARTWHYGQSDGQEVDIEAYLRYRSDALSGDNNSNSEQLYKALNSGARDLSCLLLADLSLSTDTWVNNDSRVVDMIRDGLYLFAESLNATGDRFGMYGFSSRKTNPIRIHTIKEFDEPYGGKIRSRIANIKPGYYTRMGAGIRHATELLKDQVATQQLLLILTDGKPNDLDVYEGRYGIEDTKHAVLSAKKLGLKVFCITIDEEANDYLPNIFGSNGYALVRKITDLPKSLPMLYARLTL